MDSVETNFFPGFVCKQERKEIIQWMHKLERYLRRRLNLPDTEVRERMQSIARRFEVNYEAFGKHRDAFRPVLKNIEAACSIKPTQLRRLSNSA